MDIDSQVQAACAAFAKRFGRPARFAAAAPGRVNLIGEHTDYNDGFVLPMAIDRQTLIVADHATPNGADSTSSSSSSGSRQVNLYDIVNDTCATFVLDDQLKPGEPKWSNYPRGVAAGCLAHGLDPGGFDAVIHSTVPLGGGLSSSAALEVATATLIEVLAENIADNKPDHTLEPQSKALLCQQAEHEFASMPCGIMDQFISVMAKANHAMLLDCRSLTVRMTPLTDPTIKVLIINSNIKHELTGSEYADRRKQCQQACAALGVSALRDADMPMLEAAGSRLDQMIYKRARHVITENDRTIRAADAMETGDWALFGSLMVQSHMSLRDDYQVSCAELDTIVNLVQEYGAEQGGVYGVRMTGGGFGGCAVALVDSPHIEPLTQFLELGYHEATGISPGIFATAAAGGCYRIQLPV